ncbi:MAG: hypothetical protein [Caudoviricetes sp.]|nr:MAG: hypothetical protein [Caudoviricetes sp.]
MALSRKDLFTLAKTVAKADPHSQVAYSFGDEKFSYSDLNETLRAELKEIAGTYQLYRENQNTVFSLIEEVIDEVLPQKVLDQYSQFAEIKTFNQNDRPVFTQRISTAARRRAKQFITKVGLAGVYEVFKLDGKSYEIPTSAFGGAAQIGFEEFLDGRVDFADVLDIVMEGLDEAIYLEIERALKGAVTSLQPANFHTDTKFSEVEMDKLLQVADSYGQATIYCTFEFAATMLPAEGWASNNMKDQIWNNGYLGNYKGHNVVVLRQSFEDETNSKKVIDPSYAFIIPTGAEKPVKVAFEGTTNVREYENKDWSREIQVYKKVGVGAIVTNNICVYQNTSLAA